MGVLGPRDVLRIRMAALLVHRRPVGIRSPATVGDVVRHLGAMQAQDGASGLWSLGLRLPGATLADVSAALEGRQALRTWPMRGTVHLVPARDAHWMLACTGTRVLTGAQRRRAAIGLADDVADRAVDLLGEALAGGRRLSRAALLDHLKRAGVPVHGSLGYHLLWYASQRGVTAIAPDVDGEQTFVLLDEWVPDPVRLEGDDALAMLATRYFRSHGPTTRQDFAGWTGLTVAESRRAVAAAGAAIAPVTVDGVELYADPALLDAHQELPQDDEVHALPGFDEYLLGYKDRSLMLTPTQLSHVVPGGNGMFRSTLVRSGRVVGTWTRTTRGKRGAVTAIPLGRLGPRTRASAEAALLGWATFIGVPLEVHWSDS